MNLFLKQAENEARQPAERRSDCGKMRCQAALRAMPVIMPSTSREPGQRLLWHALPFVCALILLSLLGLMLRQI